MSLFFILDEPGFEDKFYVPRFAWKAWAKDMCWAVPDIQHDM